MPYYHIKVLLRTSSSSSTEADFELNLSEEQTNAIAEQYENKEAIFVNGRWSKVSDVEQIEIRETPQKTDYYSPQIRLETIFLTHAFPNVTRRFIKLPPKEQTAQSQKARKPLSKDIFIVHGRDHEPMKELKTLLIDLGFNPIVLHEQASGGSLTLVEKLEKYARDIGYAFVILTPEDVGGHRDEMRNALGADAPFYRKNLAVLENEIDYVLGKFEPRARQNVIFEMGYFFGLLERKRVCCLLKGEMKKPTDIDGVEYGHFDNSINEAKGKIIKELKEAGYEIKA